MLKKIILGFGIFCCSFSQAGFLLDLGLGYSAGTQLKYTLAATNYTFNESGIPITTRIGYMNSHGFFTSVNAMYTAAGALAGSAPTGTKDDTFSRLAAGIDFGYQYKRLRVFAGYSALDNITITRNTANLNSPDVLYGTGIFGGLGVVITPKFAIDFRYDSHTYTKYDKNTTKGATISGTNYNPVTDSSMSVLLNYTFMGAGK